MPNEAQALLDAEQATTKLIAELEALTSQVGSYGRASGELAAIRQDAQRLVQEATNLTSRAREAIQVMGALGTPEILARIDAAVKASQDASQQSRDAGKAASESVDAIRALSGAMGTGFETTRSTSAELHKAIHVTLADQAIAINAASKSHEDKLQKGLTAVSKRVTTVLIVAIASTVLSAVAVAALAYHITNGH